MLAGYFPYGTWELIYMRVNFVLFVKHVSWDVMVISFTHFGCCMSGLIEPYAFTNENN